MNVPPFARPELFKLFKNLIYVWHGCGMQFEMFYSLNDSVVGSFPHFQHLGFQTDNNSMCWTGMGCWRGGTYTHPMNCFGISPWLWYHCKEPRLSQNIRQWIFQLDPLCLHLGRKASNIVDMDSQSTQQNTQLRMDAYREKELLEVEDISDQ